MARIWHILVLVALVPQLVLGFSGVRLPMHLRSSSSALSTRPLRSEVALFFRNLSSHSCSLVAFCPLSLRTASTTVITDVALSSDDRLPLCDEENRSMPAFQNDTQMLTTLNFSWQYEIRRCMQHVNSHARPR
jgi:hypothetical protein